MGGTMMSVKKVLLVFLSVLAIFAILALIRHETNMLVSGKQEQPTVEKTSARQASIETRDA